MSPATASLRPLAHQWRAHGPTLIGAAREPHIELLTLVWGPTFDREHAMDLLARQPNAATQSLPALLAAADQFDALGSAVQRRLRRMILRHRALTHPRSTH